MKNDPSRKAFAEVDRLKCKMFRIHDLLLNFALSFSSLIFSFYIWRSFATTSSTLKGSPSYLRILSATLMPYSSLRRLANCPPKLFSSTTIFFFVRSFFVLSGKGRPDENEAQLGYLVSKFLMLLQLLHDWIPKKRLSCPRATHLRFPSAAKILREFLSFCADVFRASLHASPRFP